MESSPAKRRKISQSGTSLDINGVSSSLDAAASSAGLYRPSTFILETEELLREVRVDYSKSLHGVDEILHKVKSAVENLKLHGPIPIHEASSKFEKANGVVIPFPAPRPGKDSQYKLSLEKPSGFNVVGSYVSKTMVKSQRELTVDMIVEMPRSMFQEKDYLNLRYFYKRSYFLANLAVAISKSLELEMAFEQMGDNPLTPVLILKMEQEVSKRENKGEKRDREVTNGSSASVPRRTLPNHRVRVIPCAPEGLFPKAKLSSTRNCIRPAGAEEKNEKKETAALPPTPFYNSSLKAEGLYLTYLKVLRQTEKTSPAFKDACVLGRIWLQQRGFGGSVSRGGFGHFEWSLLLVLLMRTGGRKGEATLSSSLSSHQMFKATIQFLAKSDLGRKPVVLGKPGDGDFNGKDSLREPGPLLYDATRSINFGYKMSPWSASMLSRYAKWTLGSLNDSSGDQFTPTFITKADVPLQVFDLLVRVPCHVAGEVESGGSQGRTYDFAIRLYKIVKKALTGRAELIHIQIPEHLPWATSESGGSADSDSDTVLVGVVFDPLEMARKVDHGPSAEDKVEARKYRQFWGERAELRRFKDGNIQETLIWTKDTAFSVCEEIISYILKLHLKISHGELDFSGNGFTSLISAKPTDAAAFAAAREAFAVLERDIRSLEDLPLQVRQLAATAPELCSSSVNVPSFGSPKAPYTPMDVVIYFEASGKWPDNLAAIQRTKVAFLLKIGELLEATTSPAVATHIGLEDAQHEHANLAFLDIVYSEEGGSGLGPVFRLRVHSDMEESLLERQTRDKTLEQHVRAESANLLAASRRLYTHLPLLSSTVSTYCTRFPALSPSIRLAKRWFAAHKLLGGHFGPELVELLVLHAFANPAPWQTPSGAGAGLLRTLLLLSRWDWRSEPLVVDPSGDMDAGGREAVAARLSAWRRTLDPAMNRTVLVVATPWDPTGTAFTSAGGRASPSKVAAARATALARSACRLVREGGDGGAGSSLDPRMLFTPSLAEYDVLLRLSRPAVRALRHGLDADDGRSGQRSKFKNLDAAVSRPRAPVARDPVVALLDQLEKVYGSVLVWFHGCGGGGGADDLTVGGIWNPMVERRSFRVNLPCSFRPAAATSKKGGGSSEDEDTDEDDSDAGDDDIVEVNREAILSEIARIGAGLIESIKVNGEKT